MRLFTAIDFSEEVKQTLDEQCRELQKHITRGYITDKNNFHMTLVFIGEVAFGKVGAIKEAVEAAAANIARDNARAIPVTVEGLSSFARVGEELVWVGVKSQPADIFHRIASALAGELESRGIMLKESDKKFTPHVTLARKVEFWRMSGKDLAQVYYPPIYTSAKKITLMESVQETTRNRSGTVRTKQVYKPLHEVEFVK